MLQDHVVGVHPGYVAQQFNELGQSAWTIKVTLNPKADADIQPDAGPSVTRVTIVC